MHPATGSCRAHSESAETTERRRVNSGSGLGSTSQRFLQSGFTRAQSLRSFSPLRFVPCCADFNRLVYLPQLRETLPGKTQATARASCAGRKCFYLFLWGGGKSQEARLPWSPLSDWSEATRRRGDTCSDPPSSSAIWCLTSAESWCCEIECSGWALSRSPKH